jgi:hypothetical protein
MDNRANAGGTRPSAAERPPESGAAVLRLLRGEDLDPVSRALGVTVATLTGWRRFPGCRRSCPDDPCRHG